MRIDNVSVQPNAIHNGTTYIGLESIGTGGHVNQSVTVLAGELLSAKSAFNPRHVLFGKLRPNLGKVARPSVEGVCSTDIYPLLPGPKLSRDYLAHWLLRPESIALAASRTSGANLPRLNGTALRSLEIPLPPLPEQRRIAAILDQADDLRTKRRRTLVLLDELADAIFIDMFDSGAEQAEVTVEEALRHEKNSIRTGPFGSQLLHSEFTDSGIPVLGIDNVVTNEFSIGKPRFISAKKYDQLKRYTVVPGDVLITIMGTVGRCAVVPADIGTAINTKHLCCMTLDVDRCLPEYLKYYFLKHSIAKRYLERVSKGAIMDGLNMGLIRALPLHLPLLERQTVFVEAICRIDESRSEVVASITEADALFASLQHRAFRGEL